MEEKYISQNEEILLNNETAEPSEQPITDA